MTFSRAAVAGSLSFAFCLAPWPAPADEAQQNGRAPAPEPSAEVIAFCRPAAPACECSLEGMETLIEPEIYARFLSMMRRGGALTGAEMEALDQQRRAVCDPSPAAPAAAGTIAKLPTIAGRSRRAENRGWPKAGPRRQGLSGVQEVVP